MATGLGEHGPQLRVGEGTEQADDPESDPQQACAKANAGDAVQIVQQARGEKRVDLAQEDDLPPVARDQRVERGPFWITKKTALDPLPPQSATDAERGGRARQIADHVQKKPPPQAEKKSAADGDDSTGEQEEIARGEEERIQHAAPDFHAADRCLRARDVVGGGKLSDEPRDEDRRACYLILDRTQKKIFFRRIDYDYESTIKKIYAVPELDNMLGDRLRTGR